MNNVALFIPACPIWTSIIYARFDMIMVLDVIEYLHNSPREGFV